MKILAFGDLHGNYQKAVDHLKENKYDLIIITGDITNFGPDGLGEEILNEISQFDTPVLTIPGNCDLTSIYGEINNSNAVNIHDKCVIIENVNICGFGGSNPTPFNTPLEFEEIQIYEEISKILEEQSNQGIKLLITHAPPYDTKADLIPSGDHVGSKSIRKVIEEFQPALNICGHIHESRNTDKIGTTVIVNPGDLASGYCCLVNINNLNNKIETDIIKLK